MKIIKLPPPRLIKFNLNFPRFHLIVIDFQIKFYFEGA